MVKYLTLGAIVSVAIAWSQPLWTTWFGRSKGAEVKLAAWPREFPGPHGPPTSSSLYRSPGSSGLVAVRDEGAEHAAPEALIWTYIRHTKGIPLHCVGCEMWGSFSPREATFATGSSYAASPTFHVSGYTFAPVPESLRKMLHASQVEILYRPEWLGLIADSLFWGAAVALLAQIPLRLRARARRRASLCPTCGYAMADAARCSECGTPRS